MNLWVFANRFMQERQIFAAHTIAQCWRQEGSQRYPRSRQLLILSDTGGCNGSRRRAWKTGCEQESVKYPGCAGFLRRG
jgi:hypothetical protein